MNVEEFGEVRDDAFHVTAADNMASIAADGFRTDRRGVLGSGAYFDLETEASGWKPARERYPDQALVVFRCEVALGRVLDVDDEEVRQRFQIFQRGYVREVGRDVGLELGQGGYVDEFLKSLAEKGEVYETVKRTFTTDGYTRIAVRDPQHIRVLSVRNEQGDDLTWLPTSL
jgi:hypothetical protein